MSPDFQREYLLRLPLPLAQLYSRAYNAKDPRGRHDNTFYLFEAFTKLAVAPLVAAYLHEAQQGAPRLAALDRLLAQLALPSLGQWVRMLRDLAHHFGHRPDAASHPLGHLWGQLTAARRDLPGLLALYRRIKNGPDGQPVANQSCAVLQVVDALVQYRNAVFGHGAGRFEAFYEREMGPLLFPAANDLLAEGVLDLLGPRGSRLAYLTELRLLDEGRVEVSFRELVGLQGERAAPLLLSNVQADALSPNRVALLWPGRPAPLLLDPLLVYRESELAEEVLFLNRDRDGRQVEYLSYTTGRTERDRSTAPALAALLSRVTGRAVSEEQLQKLAEQSIAETPSVEALFGEVTRAAWQVGDYEILAEIGRGGMGVVYLARQLSLGRLVALKMLPADLAADEVALARFRREVRALGRCEHPNIVKVLASGTLPDGRIYYAMEYVPGCDLEKVWQELSGSGHPGDASSLGSSTWARAVLDASRKQRSQSTGVGPEEKPSPSESPRPLPLPPLPELPSIPDDPGGYVRRVAALVRDAALALQAVHDQHLVHRDVKPGNLMLTPDGQRVVLMDFGLAKGRSLATSVSRGGGLLGTLRYAAPEQLAAASLKVGPQADVRGLGLTLWELLTRRRLFAEAQDEKQLALMVHDQDVPKLRSIDPTLDRDLEAIVARATERRVADRIQTAGLLAEYLQLYLDGRSLPIRPPGPAELLRRWVREHRGLVGSAAGLVALALAFAVTVSVVVQMRHAKELSALEHTAETQLNREDWTPADVEQVEGSIRLLEPLARDQAAGYRQRLIDQLHKAILRAIQQPRLEAQDVARCEALLQALAARDVQGAQELRERLRQRLRDWETVLEVKAPFTGVGEPFATAVAPGHPEYLMRSEAKAEPVVLTSLPCSASMKADARFDPSGTSADSVGLLFNGSRGKGRKISCYAFMLAGISASARPGESAETLAGLQKAGGLLYLQILRNGVCQREQAVPVPAGPLTLHASREGDQLTVQVNDLPPLKFLDAFPLASQAGSYGLHWPTQVRLLYWHAQRQTRAATPSPLEQADDLYNAGRYADAEAIYQRQALTAVTENVVQEARYKTALCLVARDPEKAVQLLERVAGENGERWPPAAASRLWLLHLTQDHFDKAEAVFDTIKVRYPFEQLLAVMPDDARHGILRRYLGAISEIGLLFPPPDYLDRARRAVRVADFLGASDASQWSQRSHDVLMRAYQMAGQTDQAIQTAEACLRRWELLPAGHRPAITISVLTDYCWMLKLRGETARARKELDRWLFISPGVRQLRSEAQPFQWSLLERVRLDAALEDWQAAEQDNSECFRLAEVLKQTRKTDYDPVNFFAACCLLQGFLRERQGDITGAQSAWHRGLIKSQLPGDAEGAKAWLSSAGANGIVLQMLLAGLTNELTEAESDALLGRMLVMSSGGQPLVNIAGVMHIPPSALRLMWQSPRGRAYARKIAFRDIPFEDTVRVPFFLLAVEVLCQGAFAGPLTSEQDALVWQWIRDVHALCIGGKLGQTSLLQLAMTWKGTTNFLGWASVSPALPPGVRGPGAYVFGHRFLRLKKPHEAAMFFRTALEDAPADSPLRQMAQAELDKLKAK